MDYTTLTDDEFYPLREAVEAEFRRRQVLQRAISDLNDLNAGVLRAQGREPGDPWVQPTGAHDAYPSAWEVTHQGKRWASLIPANTTTPGSDPRWWKDLTPQPEPEDPAAPQPWQPGLDLAIGDLVTYQDVTYRVIQAHTTQAGWTPDILAALFQRVIA